MTTLHLEVLVEEESMERALRHLLPKIVGDLEPSIKVFRGKVDLLRKLPLLLRGYANWFTGQQRLLVVVDRDDDDCHELKNQLESAALTAGLSVCHATLQQPGVVLNRIVIEELEAWFIGDVAALRKAYPQVPASLGSKSKFRDPDAIVETWEALEKVLRDAGHHKAGLKKIGLAEDVAPHLDLDANRSHSFRTFVSGVRFLIEGAA